jgi:hypothetical protein
MHIKTYDYINELCVLSSDVMVLNDIIEQAAGRQSRASEQGGKYS